MLNPSGIPHNEYYLYSEKAWEMAPMGVSLYTLEHAIQQNAPVVVTASGYETTNPTDPWAQISGSGKYTKRGWGYFDTLDDGSPNESKNQFALHPDSSGKIIFNKTIDENVYIEYEAGASGHYILDSVDINPIRNEFESGFLHHSKVTDPNSLYLMSTQGTLKADGYQTARLIATIYDYDFDRVSGRNVVFEIDTLDGYSELGHLEPSNGYVNRTDPSGSPVEIIEETDGKGEARVKYWTHDEKTGVQTLRASYLNTNDPNYEDVRDICVLQHKLNDSYNRDVQDGSLNGRTGLANENTEDLSDDSGVINNCFSFNGTNQYVETTANITAPKCFACWIKPRAEQSSATSYHILFSKDSGYNHGLFVNYETSPNKIVAHFKDTDGLMEEAAYEIETYTEWYFVIGQLESDNKVKLYIQNVLQDTSGIMLQTLEDTSSYPFRIAGGLADRYLYAKVDNCMSFNRALTEDERSFLWNNGDGRERLWYPGAIFDRVQIAQFYISADPFILDLSLLDMLDYLT